MITAADIPAAMETKTIALGRRVELTMKRAPEGPTGIWFNLEARPRFGRGAGVLAGLLKDPQTLNAFAVHLTITIPAATPAAIVADFVNLFDDLQKTDGLSFTGRLSDESQERIITAIHAMEARTA
jgi:hypothetical protein